MCWGRQVGPAPTQLANFSVPTAVAGGGSWNGLASGSYVNSSTGQEDAFACGIRADGSLACCERGVGGRVRRGSQACMLRSMHDAGGCGCRLPVCLTAGWMGRHLVRVAAARALLGPWGPAQPLGPHDLSVSSWLACAL